LVQCGAVCCRHWWSSEGLLYLNACLCLIEHICVFCTGGREYDDSSRERESPVVATHCNKLQYTATHCNTLQHIATHCNTLQHMTDPFETRYRIPKRERKRKRWRERDRESLVTATHCNTLQHTATHCNTLQHTATHCNTLQLTATHDACPLEKMAYSSRLLAHHFPPFLARVRVRSLFIIISR